MSDLALDSTETGLRFAQGRGALLAQDVANARTPGFVAQDASLIENDTGEGSPFAAVMHEVDAHGPVSVLEYAMGAQARNAVTYHELVDQERAMLREFRTVAEESRR